MFLANNVNYQGGEATTMPSHSIWTDCPQVPDVALFGDDFLGYTSIATTAIGNNGWHAILDTSCTNAPLATEVGGVVRLATTATDNDFASLISNGNVGNICKVDSSTGKKFWFEARVRLNQIVTQTAYIGLVQGAVNAAAVLPDGTALSTKDFLGFHVLEADTDAFQTGYNNGAADTGTVHNAAAGVVTAASWVKLGVKFDGNGVYFFINGVKVAPAATVPAASLYRDGTGLLPDATDVPDGEELAVLFALQSKAAAITTLDIDWVYCAQQR